MWFDIFVQAIGFVGIGLNIWALQYNKHWRVILLKTLGSLMFVVQYLLLGAYTGATMDIIGIIRNLFFIMLVRKGKNTTIAIAIFSAITIGLGVASWEGYISLLAIFAKTLTTVAYGIKSARVIRLCNLPSSSCWLAYNLISFSLAGILNEIFVLVSILIAEIRFSKNNKKQKNKNKIEENTTMEFKVFQKELELQSRGWIPTFHDVSKEVMEIVKASGIKNGTVAIASHHTTCSVMVQECSHDIDSFDLEYLQHDLLDIMRKLIPDFAEEGQYRHPGPIHAQFGRYVNEPGNYTSMNTDGHLRSVFFGRSETMTIKDGVLDGGEFAHIYFIDWDHVRARRRQLNVTVMGTTDDVEDRKWNNGEVINTLRKFTDEEKAYDIHYDLQLKR